MDIYFRWFFNPAFVNSNNEIEVRVIACLNDKDYFILSTKDNDYEHYSFNHLSTDTTDVDYQLRGERGDGFYGISNLRFLWESFTNLQKSGIYFGALQLSSILLNEITVIDIMDKKVLKIFEEKAKHLVNVIEDELKFGSIESNIPKKETSYVTLSETIGDFIKGHKYKIVDTIKFVNQVMYTIVDETSKNSIKVLEQNIVV